MFGLQFYDFKLFSSKKPPFAQLLHFFINTFIGHSRFDTINQTLSKKEKTNNQTEKKMWRKQLIELDC